MSIGTALLVLLAIAALVLFIMREFRAPRESTAAAGYFIAFTLIVLALIAKELP